MSEPQPWEDDAQAVREVNRLIKEIELATGIPTARIVLAGDSEIAGGFAASVVSLGSGAAWSRKVRADNLEPNRIVSRFLRYADHILETTEADLVYTYEWAMPWSFTVWLAAQRRGIPCIAVRRSKIRSDHCYVTADRQMFNVAARTLASAKRISKKEVSDSANEYIRLFREQPRMINYIQVKWTRRARDTWLNWHADWARSTASKVLRLPKRPAEAGRVAQAGRELAEFNAQTLKSWRQQRFLRTFNASELAAMKYIYFPVHKETDLTVNFQAASWFDQRNTIRLLASVVPNGYRLLVREHRQNYGLRPSSYYRELSRLPNVVLVDAFDSQFKYVANADLVVTENGSSGWEGLLLKRRVLTLSTTFYDGAGRARNLERREDLGGVIVDVMSDAAVTDAAAHDRDLACMIDAEIETTFNPQAPTAALEHLSAAVRSLLEPNQRAACG
jgi:hypothetical protein